MCKIKTAISRENTKSVKNVRWKILNLISLVIKKKLCTQSLMVIFEAMTPGVEYKSLIKWLDLGMNYLCTKFNINWSVWLFEIVYKQTHRQNANSMS